MSALCLPDSWLQHFNDLPLVAVLAAHRDADSAERFSERDCVERTRLDRKTVRRKRNELAALRVLLPNRASCHDPHGVSWRIDRERLSQLVENAPSLGEKGTSSWSQKGPVVGEKGTSSWSQKGPVVGEKGTSSWSQKGPVVGEKGTSSPDASLLNLVSSSVSELAGAKAEEKQLEQDLRETIAAADLYQIHGEPLDDKTVRNAMKHLLRLECTHYKFALEKIERECRKWKRRPSLAETWGILVWFVEQTVNKLIGEAPRKAPAMETADLKAKLKADAARMGSRR